MKYFDEKFWQMAVGFIVILLVGLGSIFLLQYFK
jgi:hypothetical protein